MIKSTPSCNRIFNKVVLVTGGGAGLGAATCELLASEGGIVIVSDINSDLANHVAKKIQKKGGQAIACAHDVASELDWQRVIEMTLANYGRLDVLVNNAGICLRDELKETSLENWRRVFSVNMEGAFLGMRAAIKAMNQNDDMSSIVNIASIAGLVGDNPVPYSASKGGMRMLSKSAAIECAQKGYKIRVNTVYPGPMDTPLSAPLKEKPAWSMVMKLVPLGRMADPMEIARGVLFLASDESSYMTGSDLVIDGGVSVGTGGLLIDID